MERLRKHKTGIILSVILLLASFLRLYRISDYLTFLGDEGRDVLIVRQILEGDFTLLGPRSSAADFFYGPIYYYLITPFLWLFRYDPVGPAVFIALVGIATVYLVYRVAKEFFQSTSAGLIAAALYSVSPVIITYSRSSWNPNPLPFVSLLSLYVLYKAIIAPKWWKFLFIGFLLGVGLQMQYLALFLAVVIAVYTLLGTIIQEIQAFLLPLIKRYLQILGGFLIGFSPFIAFEILHGFPNTKTIFNFLLGRYSQDIPPYGTPFSQIADAFFKIFGRLVTRFPETNLTKIDERVDLWIWYVLTMLIGVISAFLLLKVKNKLAALLLAVWLVVGVGLFGFYKKEIYDYYLGFLFPLPFLLVSNTLRIPFEMDRKFVKIGSILLFLILFINNLLYMPFRFEPNRQKDQVKKIAEFVIAQTDNKPYNFALITPGNSDHAYRYYFKVLGHEPVVIENTINDPKRETVTDQLLIVCEDTECGPLGHPLFEVAAFGRAEIVDSWDVSVVKVYKLTHYEEPEESMEEGASE